MNLLNMYFLAGEDQTTNGAEIKNFCDKTKDIWNIVGVILTILKIVIPIILVVLGSIDLLKAVTSDDKDMIKKQSMVLGKRAIAAIIIFFIPTIIEGVFALLSVTSGTIESADQCWKCATGSSGCQKTAPAAG